MNRTIFRSKHASETARLVFDFLSLLAVGETLSSVSLSSALYSGEADDALTLTTGVIDGSQVATLAAAGTEGVTYLVTCSALTSLGQAIPLSGYLTISPEGM